METQTTSVKGYEIRVMYAYGWRKLRGSVLFTTREGAEAYCRKYLIPGRWKVVEIV